MCSDLSTIILAVVFQSFSLCARVVLSMLAKKKPAANTWVGGRIRR